MNRMFYVCCAVGGGLLALGVTYLSGDKPENGATRGIPIMIAGIQGAPGDGNSALRTAFGVMLENAEIPQADDLDGCALAVSAEVSTERAGDNDHVSIVWQVHDSQGRSLGEVAQVNEVPAGKLDGSWGTDASLAARGARDGIVNIIRRQKLGCT